MVSRLLCAFCFIAHTHTHIHLLTLAETRTRTRTRTDDFQALVALVAGCGDILRFWLASVAHSP